LPKNLQELVLKAMIRMVITGSSLAAREERYFPMLLILLLLLFVLDIAPGIPKLFMPGWFGEVDA